MRSATKEERESVDRYIKSISHKTGISLCIACSNSECVFQSGVVREQCDFYEKRTIGLTKEELNFLKTRGGIIEREKYDQLNKLYEDLLVEKEWGDKG